MKSRFLWTETKIHKAPKKGLCDRPTSINKYHLGIIIATQLWEIGVALFLGLPHYYCGRLVKPRTKSAGNKAKNRRLLDGFSNANTVLRKYVFNIASYYWFLLYIYVYNYIFI
jgi:hypothetical protein